MMDKEQIVANAEDLRACIAAVKKTMPRDFLGEEIGFFVPDDYRQMGTTVYIQTLKNQKNSWGAKHKKDSKDKSEGGYQGHSSDKQQELIASILIKTGNDGAETVDGFLEDNGIKIIDDLSKSLATSLIGQLIILDRDQTEEKKKETK